MSDSKEQLKDSPENAAPVDTLEEIIHVIPVVLPLAGAVLMFLLAFIAIYLA